MAGIEINTDVWGIFRNGELYVDVHFERVQARKDSQITNYPVENGNFTSVNKVSLPNTVQLDIIQSGTDDEIRRIDQRLSTLLNSVITVDVVTPTFTILGVNLITYDVRISNDTGLGVLAGSLTFQEVRSVQARYSEITLPPSSVRDSEDMSTQDNGLQTNKTVAATVVDSVNEKLNQIVTDVVNQLIPGGQGG